MHALCQIVRIGLFAALIAASLMFDASAVSAQLIPCGERYTILKTLKQQYDEQRTAFGVTADGRLLEVVVSPRGSWTILLTRPGGLTCLVTSGDGWRQIVEPRDEPIT